MAEIYKFKVKYDDLLSLADKAYEEGDVVKHVEYLRRAMALDAKRTEAPMRLSQTYSELEAYEISNELIYRTLDKGVDDYDRAAFFGQLAINFAELDMPDVAEYYLRDYSDDFEFSYDEAMARRERFHLVKPNQDDSFEDVLDRAYELLQKQRFDAAIALLDEAEKPSAEAVAAADHVILICYMLKNDIDGAIARGERMLEEDGGALIVVSTLASAYIMRDRQDDARKMMEKVTKTVYTQLEDIMLLLPLLVNFGMHEQIASYCGEVLKKKKYQPNIMMWQAIALYNIGKKEDAVKVMRQVDALYGDNYPAKIYVKLFESSPERVDYSSGLPEAEKGKRQRRLRALLGLPDELLMALFDDDSPEFEEDRKLVELALKDGVTDVKALLMQKLGTNPTPQVIDFFKRMLLSADLSCEVFSTTLIAVLDRPEAHVDLNVVAEDRFKELHFFKPITYFAAPEPLATALRFALAEIAFTDEEPSAYIEKLFGVIDEVMPIGNDHRPVETKRLGRIRRLKSIRTVVGVLLGRVYREEESREEILARYDLKASTYDKYQKIFFGDEDGEE